jgi:aerobic-type carbon monoxide dehydrogenase small subunit (CoxS/CutS family)
MSAQVVFRVDGQDTNATDGMMLSAALLLHGFRAVRRNPVVGDLRGAFCGMGACFECEVVVDGRTVRACLTLVRAGLDVRTDTA